MDWLQTTSEGVVLSLRVVPRAARTEVNGVLGDSLKIRLQAPPVDGKANECLIRFLCETLQVPASRISLLSGQTGRNKRVLIAGVQPGQVKAQLGQTN